jgi:hypothetical protein
MTSEFEKREVSSPEKGAASMVGILGTKRTVGLLCAVAFATVMVVLALAQSKPARAASDLLPDLGMARLGDLQIRKCPDLRKDCAYVGQRQLRFDTIIVNVGAGSFEARGKRSNTSASMTVTQRIYNDAGGYRDAATTAEMYFAGDGHTHWHLRDLESYELIRLDNGSKVGAGAKEGFCFFDNYPFGSTQARFYTGCGRNPDALQVRMGLSRGWGDIYGKGTFGQYIDITNLTSGRYRLQATADAANWFSESNDTNNFTWVDIHLSGNSFSVVEYGPAAQPI